MAAMPAEIDDGRRVERRVRGAARSAMLVCFALGAVLSLPGLCFAQDAGGEEGSEEKGRVATEIFLEDEELDVEADLPSVDLVLTFKGLRYENIDPKTSFFPELYRTVEQEPF